MRNKMSLYFFILLILCFCFFFYIKNYNEQKKAPLFDNLGDFHHSINTKSTLAQRYFDQGLTLLYSFEYGEAIRSLRASIKADPNCAMCYWGLALALGSKTDMPLNGNEISEAQNLINIALKKVDKQNLPEKLYISALAQRYTNLTPQKMDEFSGLCSGYSAVTGSNVQKYATAMQKVSSFLPNDPDAKTLYAISLIDLIEWNFWNKEGKPNLHTMDIVHLLEEAMKINPNHPGANHFYVHVMEWSPYRLKALPNALRLDKIAPGAEHLAHMASHIYYTLGRYHDATLSNQHAIQLYKNYASICLSQGFKPEIQFLYYHNYDYLTHAASQEGRKKLSIEMADQLASEIYPIAQKTTALQKLLTNQFLMRLRFAEWNEILKMSAPSNKFQYALGIWYYARAFSEIELNKIEDAKKDLKKLQDIVNQGPINANLSKVGDTLLKIAENVLQAMLANHAANFDQASLYFKKAIQLQDSLTSADPPLWYMPVRQLYGYFLLHSGHFKEAEIIFKEDLKNNPHNGWSLHGLVISLKQNKKAIFIQEFNEAWTYSDIPTPDIYFK